MAKIEITLTPDYVGSWGIWEGLREIIQNALDGKTEFGGETIIKRTDEGFVWIENTGVTLPAESLLLGYSTKRDKPKTIGQFGEGLKLGILALLRKGCEIKIFNGQETWTPSIEMSEKFNSEVLVFRTRKSLAKGLPERIVVVIKGISEEDWGVASDRILAISGEGQVMHCGYHGSLLMDRRHAKRVYVKGVYVGDIDSSTHYGFDLRNVVVDRDRKMVSNWDMEWAIGAIFNNSIKESREVLAALWDLLEAGDPRIGGFVHHADKASLERITTMFFDKYGPNAVFVKNMAESREAAHYGKVGIVVPTMMFEVLKRALPTFESVKREKTAEIVDWFGWGHLDDDEQEALVIAADAIAYAKKMSTQEVLAKVNVVAFRGDEFLGKWENGQIYISRKVLKDKAEAVHTLAHEFSHEAGSDGSTGHVETMGQILSAAYVGKHMANENACCTEK